MSLNIRLASRLHPPATSFPSSSTAAGISCLASRRPHPRPRPLHPPPPPPPPQKLLFSSTRPRPRGENYQCWNCDHKNTVFCLFCEKCAHVLEPQEVREGRLDYFQVLGLPRKYELSKQMLASSFRALQAKLHPDKFAVASDEEKEASEENSALVNTAYSVLKNPLARGMHLLELQGVSLEDGAEVTDPGFLMEVMEENEAIVECCASGEKSMDRLREMHEANEKRMAEHSERLAEAFQKKDYETARRILAEMKYFENIHEKLVELGVGAEN